MTLEPMTEEAAAWVREHVWRDGVPTFRPAMADRCRCEWGLSPACKHGQHGKCSLAERPVYEWETIVGGRRRGFPEPYEHPVRVGPGAGFRPDLPVYVHTPYVWLADRMCRWMCPCDCHGGQQLDLFGGGVL